MKAAMYQPNFVHIVKAAFIDIITCFIHYCSNLSWFTEYCKKWKFESHYRGAQFADLCRNKKKLEENFELSSVAHFRANKMQALQHYGEVGDMEITKNWENESYSFWELS